jgi:hypothetical protein
VREPLANGVGGRKLYNVKGKFSGLFLGPSGGFGRYGGSASNGVTNTN